MKQAIDLLRAEAAVTSIGDAAKRCGISRAAASLLLNGKYNARTGRMEARIEAALGRIPCPARGYEITLSECHADATSPLRAASPSSVRQWRTCQGCKHRPISKLEG